MKLFICILSKEKKKVSNKRYFDIKILRYFSKKGFFGALKLILSFN